MGLGGQRQNGYLSPTAHLKKKVCQDIGLRRAFWNFDLGREAAWGQVFGKHLQQCKAKVPDITKLMRRCLRIHGGLTADKLLKGPATRPTVRSPDLAWHPRLDAALTQKERVLLEVRHCQHASGWRTTRGGKVMQRERQVEISNGVVGVVSAEECV